MGGNHALKMSDKCRTVSHNELDDHSEVKDNIEKKLKTPEKNHSCKLNFTSQI